MKHIWKLTIAGSDNQYYPQYSCSELHKNKGLSGFYSSVKKIREVISNALKIKVLISVNGWTGEHWRDKRNYCFITNSEGYTIATFSKIEVK